MTKDVCGKSCEKEEKPRWVKDIISFPLKSYVIYRKFKVTQFCSSQKPILFLPFFPTQISTFFIFSFARQHSPLIVQGMLLVIKEQVFHSHSLPQTLIQLLVLYYG